MQNVVSLRRFDSSALHDEVRMAFTCGVELAFPIGMQHVLHIRQNLQEAPSFATIARSTCLEKRSIVTAAGHLVFVGLAGFARWRETGQED